uniref:Uncharacterized protein n=1 Tax=Daucus carota subsp. sativus TaxID=79200 RepID=A0A165Z0Q7_DAUCS
MREEDVEKLRGVIRDCMSKHLYSSAIFFADKVAAITSDPADIYMQAQALFLGRHYRRAFHLLNASKIVLRDLRFRYLAAKCLEELKEWDQCLLMLGDAKVDEYGNISHTKDCNLMYFDKDAEDREINISSAICFLRGKAYEALENRTQARLWYKAAVKADPLCYEALECLIDNYMLTSEEEVTLLSSLQFAPEDEWLSSFYSCLVRKYDKENTVEAKFKELEQEGSDIKSSNQSICTLKNNTDLLACKAEYYHQCGLCLGLPLVAIIIALKNMINQGVISGTSSYALNLPNSVVVAYGKATSFDRTFPPAWIGIGNAYAAQEEGDQAMSAYRTAARLFPGCHLPTLYIGMEHMRTNSFKLADQFLTQAKTICPSDPLVQNELGVSAYHIKEYITAVYWFKKTLAHIPSSLSVMWEPTVVNLAHALRKLRRYQEAISYYEKALTLSTRSVSTYAGLAYTYHLQDNYSDAITYYHKALWLNPEDQFCTEMLTLALADESRSGIDSITKSRRGELFM